MEILSGIFAMGFIIITLALIDDVRQGNDMGWGKIILTLGMGLTFMALLFI